MKSTDLIKTGILDSGNIIEGKLLNFSNSLLTDLKTTGNLIQSNLKEQLEPLASGFKSMFDNFFTALTKQQTQQQDPGLLAYLPYGIIGIGAIFLLNKK